MASGLMKVMTGSPTDAFNRLTARRKAGSEQQAGPSQPPPEDPAEAYELQEVKHHGPGENGQGQGDTEQAANVHETAEGGHADGTLRDQQAQAEQNAADDGESPGPTEQADDNDEGVIDDDSSDERSLSPILESGELEDRCCCARCVSRKTIVSLMLTYALSMLNLSQVITATRMCPGELDFFPETIFLTVMPFSLAAASFMVLLCIGYFTVGRQQPDEGKMTCLNSSLFGLIAVVSVLTTVHLFVVILDAFDLRQSPRTYSSMSSKTTRFDDRT